MSTITPFLIYKSLTSAVMIVNGSGMSSFSTTRAMSSNSI